MLSFLVAGDIKGWQIVLQCWKTTIKFRNGFYCKLLLNTCICNVCITYCILSIPPLFYLCFSTLSACIIQYGTCHCVISVILMHLCKVFLSMSCILLTVCYYPLHMIQISNCVISMHLILVAWYYVPVSLQLHMSMACILILMHYWLHGTCQYDQYTSYALPIACNFISMNDVLGMQSCTVWYICQYD